MPQPDRFDRFTAQARATLNVADKEARRLGHQVIGDEHLLLGLLRVGDGAASKLLLAEGAAVERMRSAVSGIVEGTLGGDVAPVAVADRGKRAILSAVDEARTRRRKYVTTVHLLLAVTYGVPGGRGQEVLKQVGVNPMKLHAGVARAERRVPKGNDERRDKPRAWSTILAKLRRKGTP